MKKYAFLLAGMLLPVWFTAAQTSAVKIGDKVPNFRLSGLINYKSTKAKLSDFKGKLVILDFWNTHCGPCVAALPKMEDLQKRFANDLQIIMVTEDDRARVLQFLERRKNSGKEVSLPGVMDNTGLRPLFPGMSLPHEVWIDQEGKLIAITDDSPVNEKNIRSILAGQIPPLRMKKDEPDIDRSNPLLTGNNGDPSAFLCHSIFTGRLSSAWGAGAGYQRLDSSRFRLLVTNQPIPQMYVFAFDRDKEGMYASNRIVLENIREENLERYDLGSKLFYEDREKFHEWADRYQFGYELIMPIPAVSAGNAPVDSDELLRRAKARMLEDMNAYFGARFGTYAFLAMRKRKCLVLKQASVGTRSLEPISQETSFRNTEDSTTYANVPASSLREMLSRCYHKLPTPVIDATNITGNISFAFSKSSLSDNLPGLRKELNMYGLDLVEEEREIEVLVIRERGL